MTRLSDNYLNHHLAPQNLRTLPVSFAIRSSTNGPNSRTSNAKSLVSVRAPISRQSMLSANCSFGRQPEAEAEWRRARAAEAEATARVKSQSEQLRNLPERVITDERSSVNQTAIGTLRAHVLELQLKAHCHLAEISAYACSGEAGRR